MIIVPFHTENNPEHTMHPPQCCKNDRHYFVPFGLSRCLCLLVKIGAKDLRGFITRKLLPGNISLAGSLLPEWWQFRHPEKPGVFVITIKQPVILNSLARFCFIVK
jgi:hypothetical protein